MKGLIQRWLGRDPARQLQTALTLIDADRCVEAAALLRPLADAGHAAAQWHLAELSLHGRGMVQNFVEAERLLLQAANAGEIDARSRLGELYLTGVPLNSQPEAADEPAAPALDRLLASNRIRKNPETAAHWNQSAAADGHPAAQARLGYQLATGIGLARDIDAAEHWFRESATRQCVLGQLGLGMLLSGSFGARSDKVGAAQWLEAAAISGDTHAQAGLGLLYLHGDGVERDAAMGIRLIRNSAEANNPLGMYYLGEAHRIGQGVVSDAAESETWLRRASARGHQLATLSLIKLLTAPDRADSHTAGAALCRQAADQGIAEAQHLLAHLYFDGKGLPRSATQAVVWAQKAAQQRHAGALEFLAVMRLNGHGLDRDPAVAVELLQQAAELGSRAAHYRLGSLAQQGLGMPRSIATALLHLRAAAELGSAEAWLALGQLHADASADDPSLSADAAPGCLERAVELGSGDAACHLASLYLRGVGVQQDRERGLAQLTELARDGSALAAWMLHQHYDDASVTTSTAESDAAHWLARAAHLGSPPAWLRVVQWWDAGRDPGLSRAELVAELKARAHDAHQTVAQYLLGSLLLDPSYDTADIEAGLHWLDRAAQAGDVNAQLRLGEYWERQTDSAEATAAAADWYQKAAAQGSLPAIVALARLQPVGEAAPADRLADVLPTWQRAAERGDAVAQRVLGYLYLKGIALEASQPQALHWFEQASAQGDRPAQVALGGLQVQMLSDPASVEHGAALLRQAADAGYADGEFNWGVCLMRGLGTPVDIDRGRDYLRRAARRGHAQAQRALADLQRALPPRSA